MEIIIEHIDFDKAKLESDEAVQRALRKWGEVYTDHAKDYAPVDTGRLQNSIHPSSVSKDTIAVGTNVEYAIYQEMGTSRMRAHPFLRAAGTMGHVAEYRSIIESELKK